MASRVLLRCRSHAAAAASSALAGASLAPAGASLGAAPFLVAGGAWQPLAVRTKVSERTQRRKNLRKMKSGAARVPLLKDTLRKLYMRTHPDLFGQYPAQQQANEESYKELMGILDSIEKNNEFPPAKTLVLPFFLKTPIEGQFKEVDLRLRTTGGACNTLVEEALGRFFADCGLPSVFQWGEGSWGKGIGKDHAKNSNLDFDREADERQKQREAAEAAEAAAKREEAARMAAPAYQPVDRSAAPDHSIETVLNELNDVFEIIAAVPLMDEKEYGELRVYYEKGKGLDEIDERGFNIKPSVQRIWTGERDLTALTAGLDADSALIVQRILMHTFNIEKKVREFLENGGVDMEEEEDDDAASKN